MKAELLGENFISDLTVVNAARVSFGKERDSFDNSDEKGSDKTERLSIFSAAIELERFSKVIVLW